MHVWNQQQVLEDLVEKNKPNKNKIMSFYLAVEEHFVIFPTQSHIAPIFSLDYIVLK